MSCVILIILCFCASICLQHIMREKWINIGLEEDELKPYIETSQDVLDPVRIGNIHPCSPQWRSSCSQGHACCTRVVGIHHSQTNMKMVYPSYGSVLCEISQMKVFLCTLTYLSCFT